MKTTMHILEFIDRVICLFFTYCNLEMGKGKGRRKEHHLDVLFIRFRWATKGRSK